MDNQKPVYRKVGVLKVANGEYVKDGIKKRRWNEIGVVFATPHHSKISIRFHATANGEGRDATIFYDAGCAPRELGRSGDE